MEIKNNIRQLGKLLVEQDDFGEIYNYFFEKLVTLPAFMEMGEAKDAPILTASIQQATLNLYQSIFKDKKNSNPEEFIAQIDFLPITYIEQFGFYHGGFMVPGGMGNFFYFEEHQIGLLISTFTGDQRSWFSRFSTTVMDDDSLPIFNKPTDVN